MPRREDDGRLRATLDELFEIYDAPGLSDDVRKAIIERQKYMVRNVTPNSTRRAVIDPETPLGRAVIAHRDAGE